MNPLLDNYDIKRSLYIGKTLERGELGQFLIIGKRKDEGQELSFVRDLKDGSIAGLASKVHHALSNLRLDPRYTAYDTLPYVLESYVPRIIPATKEELFEFRTEIITRIAERAAGGAL